MIRALAALFDRLCLELVDEWRDWWRWWSVQSATALGLWNMVPLILQQRIPTPINIGVSALLLASTVIGRVVQKRKPERQADGQ